VAPHPRFAHVAICPIRGSPMTLPQLSDRTVLGAAPREWLVTLAATAIAVALIYGVRRLVLGRLTALAGHTRTGADDTLVELLRRSPFLFSIFVASRVLANGLSLTPRVERLILAAGMIALFVQLGLWANAAIRFTAERVVARRAHMAHAPGDGTIRALAFGLRFLLWSVLLLVALDTFHVDVTALIAGLGIGGIAVALAVQHILGDLFAALAIALDKPFTVGDAIQVDDFIGTVQHVGIKTTRLRGLGGEEISFPNANLLQSRIRNYRRMAERRAVLITRVAHDTPGELVARIPGIIRELVQAQQQVRFDRSHVDRFDETGIVFETVYFVLTSDYNIHMDIKHAIALQLLDRFRELGIDISFTTRQLVVLEDDRRGKLGVLAADASGEHAGPRG
jgi:small-conductance mechanosensitive channel